MPCCKAETYDWCKDEPSYEVDGNHYCVFHAPQKKPSVDEFNKLVFLRINEAKENTKLCDLSGTIFEGDISFSHFNESKPLPDISFSEATFSEETDFGGATFSGKANFSGTIFHESAWFCSAKFNEEVIFETVFGGDIYFSDTEFYKTVYFYGETFIRKGLLNNLRIKEQIRFEKVNLENVSFLDTDLRKADFTNCDWPRSKQKNRVLYDELKLYDKKKDAQAGTLKRLKEAFKRCLYPSKGYKDQITKVETLYRLLKQKYIDEHDYENVSNWHHGEKEMQRKRTGIKEPFSFLLLNLYWISAGYCERPQGAGLFLVLLIFMTTLFLSMAGLVKAPDIINSGNITSIDWLNGMDYEKAWASLLNTMKYITFQKDPFFVPKNWYGETIKLIAQILIPLQTALFALAIRNRFRR